MDDDCVRWLLQKKMRNIVSSSSTLVGFAGLVTSHFKLYLIQFEPKVYCKAMENILFITTKGRDSLPNIKNTLVKVTWLLLLLLLAIVCKRSFTAASLHICISYV